MVIEACVTAGTIISSNVVATRTVDSVAIITKQGNLHGQLGEEQLYLTSLQSPFYVCGVILD